MNGSLILIVLAALILSGLFFGGYFGASNNKKHQLAGEKLFIVSAVLGLMFLLYIHESWVKSVLYIVIAVATYLVAIWLAIEYKSHVARASRVELQKELNKLNRSTASILDDTGVV